ncbi:hypothetical protein [Roseburia intestinalis]|jgi:hypothetical protein|uniref:Uncharacterized protein n=1 Tax=Roseburia intestinalis TaxID=166486 RepID=A0A413Z5Y9_9FIRM|nr:hypothetical protein [Roseburia intestinalis]RHC16811.1 hypothetical protein DW856_10935 [Roseburia intestinalis]
MSAVEMQEVNNTVDVFKDDIDMYINLWMEERNIEDLCKISQNRWYNCCKYIYEHVFKVNPKYLKDDNNINNAYDTDKVNEVLDIYIDLCNDYEKVVNIVGFTFFTGIHRDTLNGWVNGVQLGSSGSDICKKLDEMREESLVGLQVSGKGNPMNYMPSLNKYCGFNMPGVRDQGSRVRALTASELPKLGSGNCARLPDNFDNSSPDNGEIVIDNSNNLKPSV